MDSITISSENLRYKAAGRVVLRRIGEDSLLVPVSGARAGDNRVFPINETGAFIWESLIEGRSLKETASRLTGFFSVEEGQALRDCAAYAAALTEEQLLEPVDS